MEGINRSLHSPIVKNRCCREVVRDSLRRIGVGSYLCWLLLVVLLVLGQQTPFSQFDVVHAGVVFGAVVLAIVGAGM
jgi:hypothetical protein